MPLPAGALVRSFEVLGPLGAGGMGAVYRARDQRLGRDVAIKFLQPELSQNREYLHRFEREARAASSLNHPNIITIFDIGEHEGAPFIAMELIDGSTIRELLKTGPFAIRKLLDVSTQVAEGLAAAHESGIVHRDLKPENVMVTRDGRVKIVDFGLARIERPADATESTAEFSTARTPEGRVVGTAAYVSPEQAAGGRGIDFRSDQFSFGTLMYEMATGRRAFERDTVMQTLAAIMRDEPEPISAVNSRVPAQLCWIIERCLAKDRADRYESTRDLARDLRTLRERLPETSPGNRMRVRLRRLTSHRVAVGALILTACLSAGAVVLSNRMAHPIPGPPVATRPGVKALAIFPFRDLTGGADARLFSEGLAEAVSSRLRKYRELQVSPPSSALPLLAKGASLQRVAQELGATLIVNATVQRVDDQLRIIYSIAEPSGKEIARATVDGPVQRILALQDEVGDAIARDLGIGRGVPATPHVGLETTDEQELYVRALGALEHVDDIRSIDTAIALLHELLETASEAPLVHSALARAFLAKYKLTYDREWSDKAVRSVSRAQTLGPESSDTLITLATVQSLTGKHDQAISTFRRALAVEPASAFGVIGLGDAYIAAHALKEAEQEFKRGIALNPRWWFGYNELGSLYMSQARYEEALAQYRRVIELSPQTSWGYVNAGAVLFTQEKLEDAAAMFAKAVSLDANPFAYLNLGSCHFFLGRYEKAVEYDRKAVALLPKFSTSWIELGDACSWSAQHRSAAQQAYSRAAQIARDELAVNPNNGRALATLAVALAKAGDFSAARDSIKRAITLQPQNPQHFYEAARIENLAGRRDEAVSWLRRALSSGSFFMEVQRHPEFAQLRNTDAIRELLAAHRPAS